VAPPTLSRIIAALVESGYVMREADPQDGRASLVRATPSGEQIIAGVRSERLHELHNRLERLTDEQRSALAAAVPALEALVAEDV
jgi:DNA-binding MarR family transcriptional regulator